MGARLSSRAPAGLIRPALVVVLLASALKLLGLGTVTVLAAAGAAAAAAVVVQVLRRGARRKPEPAAAQPS